MATIHLTEKLFTTVNNFSGTEHFDVDDSYRLTPNELLEMWIVLGLATEALANSEEEKGDNFETKSWLYEELGREKLAKGDGQLATFFKNYLLNPLSGLKEIHETINSNSTMECSDYFKNGAKNLMPANDGNLTEDELINAQVAYWALLGSQLEDSSNPYAIIKYCYSWHPGKFSMIPKHMDVDYHEKLKNHFEKRRSQRQAKVRSR